jgi:hypothetical protein
MKSNKENQAPLRNPALHRFPDFTGSGGACTGEANAAEHDPFQPLFHNAAGCDTHRSPDGSESDTDNRIEQARQRGYLKGLESGRQDACRMADTLLAPHVDRFFQTVDRLATFQQYIADHASTHILKLAVEIAERILGTDAHLSEADLQPLRTTLLEAICKQYRLHLRYNPQDLSDLEHLIKCRGGNGWQIPADLSFGKDLDLAQGSLNNEREQEPNQSIEKIVKPSLEQLLQSSGAARQPANR